MPNKIEVSAFGPVGCGKSAVLGEIEIALGAIGVLVEWEDPASAQSEKNLGHADWISDLEMYKPTVVLREVIDRPEDLRAKLAAAQEEIAIQRHEREVIVTTCDEQTLSALRIEPIETAPRDGTEVVVYAASYQDLRGFVCFCGYHPDAGWCADELRPVTHWLPDLTAEVALKRAEERAAGFAEGREAALSGITETDLAKFLECFDVLDAFSAITKAIRGYGADWPDSDPVVIKVLSWLKNIRALKPAVS